MYKSNKWEQTPWKECTPRQRRLRVFLYSVYMLLFTTGIYSTLANSTSSSFFLLLSSNLFLKDILLRMRADLKKREHSATILIVTSAITASICFFVLRHIDPVIKLAIYISVMAITTALLIWRLKQSPTIALEGNINK
jgi:hypothetical protein